MIENKTYDFPIYVHRFIRYLKRENYSHETIKGYEKDLKKFDAFLRNEYKDNILTEEIQKEDILDYLGILKAQGLKPNSIARNLSTLKSFYKFLVNENNFKIDVGARIKTPKTYTALPEPLDIDEIKLLLETTKNRSPYYYVFFSLLYYTGSRLTPVRTLPKKHVDLKNKKIYFHRTKNGRDLHLPLNETMYDLLSNYLIETRSNGSDYVFPSPKLHNKPISPGDVRFHLKKIAKEAGITKRVTPHILRHCTATHLTILGTDQKYVASILGHVDLRSTARYQQLNVENLRPTINKL